VDVVAQCEDVVLSMGVVMTHHGECSGSVLRN
jgi:hypothetical protein